MAVIRRAPLAGRPLMRILLQRPLPLKQQKLVSVTDIQQPFTNKPAVPRPQDAKFAINILTAAAIPEVKASEEKDEPMHALATLKLPLDDGSKESGTESGELNAALGKIMEVRKGEARRHSVMRPARPPPRIPTKDYNEPDLRYPGQ